MWHSLRSGIQSRRKRTKNIAPSIPASAAPETQHAALTIASHTVPSTFNPPHQTQHGHVTTPDFYVHPSSIVDPGAKIGKGTKIWHFCHIGPEAVIGERCSLGQNVYVGKAKIGNGVKIQNNVSVYDEVEIEDEVFCGPSMVFTNVYNPRAAIPRKDQYRKTLVKKGATIGANATIVCGVTLGEYCFIGAGAVVNRDVKPYALMLGVPARQAGWMSQSGERIPLSISGSGEYLCKKTTRRYILEGENLTSSKIQS